MNQFRSIPWAITCFALTILFGALALTAWADLRQILWPVLGITLIFLVWTIRTTLCWISDQEARRVWKVKSNRYRKQHKHRD